MRLSSLTLVMISALYGVPLLVCATGVGQDATSKTLAQPHKKTVTKNSSKKLKKKHAQHKPLKSATTSTPKKDKAAQKAKANQEAEQLFKTQSGPPPGFSAAALEEHETTGVDVYFEGRRLGTFMATFGDKNLTFVNPQAIIDKMTALQLKFKTRITQALAKKLPTHSANLCIEGQENTQGQPKPYCKGIAPKNAGIIFNRNDYKGYLFVNPDYLKARSLSTEIILPPSNAGFSVLSQANLVGSGDKDAKQFSWSSTTMASYRSYVSTLLFAYQSNFEQGQGSQNVLDVQQLTGGHYHDHTLYQAGMLQTYGGNFVSQQNVLGTNVTNDTSQIMQTADVIGTPLPIYLSTPAQVRVYKQGQLLGSWQMLPGKHYIDSSTFPNGSYNVTVQTKPSYGATTSKNMFFVKQSALPPLHHPIYHINVGVLQRGTAPEVNSETSQLQIQRPAGYTDIPVFTYSEQRAIRHSWGLDTLFTTDTAVSYLSEGIDWYTENLRLNPEVLAGTNDTYALGLNSTLSSSYGASASLHVIKFYTDSSNLPDADNTNPTMGDYFPLAANDYQVTADLSYALSEYSSFGLSGDWMKNRGEDNVDSSKSYTFTYDQTLFSTSSNSLQLAFSANKSTQDSTIMSTLTWNFFAMPYNLSVAAGHNRQNSQTDGNTTYNTFTADGSRAFEWGVNNSANTGLNVQQDNSARTTTASVDMQTHAAQSQLSVTHVKSRTEDDEDTTTFSGGLETAFAYSHGHLNYANGQGLSSGVMVYVTAPKPTPYQIYVDGSLETNAMTNHSVPIFLSPYKTYAVSIVANGVTLYEYNHNAKTAVIYKGNIKYLTWALSKAHVIFAKIIYPTGKPVKEALLVEKGGYNATDETGMIQLSTNSGVHEFKFETAPKQYCTVRLPQNFFKQHKKTFVEIKKPLICEAADRKKRKVALAKVTPNQKTGLSD
jgi:hypothetical protein